MIRITLPSAVGVRAGAIVPRAIMISLPNVKVRKTSLLEVGIPYLAVGAGARMRITLSRHLDSYRRALLRRTVVK